MRHPAKTLTYGGVIAKIDHRHSGLKSINNYLKSILQFSIVILFGILLFKIYNRSCKYLFCRWMAGFANRCGNASLNFSCNLHLAKFTFMHDLAQDIVWQFFNYYLPYLSHFSFRLISIMSNNDFACNWSCSQWWGFPGPLSWWPGPLNDPALKSVP